MALLAVLMPLSTAADDGDPARGQRAFLKCVMCHSAEPGVHKTGPSLADVWGREAGTVDGFGRYTEALKEAEVVWDADTLDAWLRDPQDVVPRTSMRIRGIESAEERQDIIVYLQQLAAGEAKAAAGGRGGGMGMMGAAELEDLSALPAENVVAALSYCPDTYTVTTAAGRSFKFWEFNLRFKTDSSSKGPPKGKPALLPSGMRGDRAFVVFAAPEEISSFIDGDC